MISHHAAIARSLGEQLELPVDVLDALGSAYEMWDGRGWPGKLSGEEVPVASRVAMLAEYVEVAHRVGGVVAARGLARKRAGKQFDPAFAQVMYRDAEVILVGARRGRDLGGGGRRRAGARDRAVRRSLRCRAGRDRELRGPEDPVHARPRAGRRRARGVRRRAARPVRGRGPHAAARRSRPRPRPARRVELDLGQAGPAWRRRVGASAASPLHHRAHAAPVTGAGAARGDRRPAPRAARRLRVPAGPVGVGDPAVGAGAGGGGRLSGDARATTVPRAIAAPMPPRSCAPKSGPAGWTPTRSKLFWARPATAWPVAARVPPG